MTVRIVVANPKGGSGKTTIAVNLAAWYARQGLQVGLMDHDPQGSASDWLRVRAGRYAPIQRLPEQASMEQVAGCDVLIHDTPAAITVDKLALWLEQADRLLMPILPSPIDMHAMVRFVLQLNQCGVLEQNQFKHALVANRVRRNTALSCILNDFMQHSNLQLLSILRDTQNYVRSMYQGMSLFDLTPSQTRVDCLSWQPILDWMGVAVAVAVEAEAELSAQQQTMLIS